MNITEEEFMTQQIWSEQDVLDLYHAVSEAQTKTSPRDQSELEQTQNDIFIKAVEESFIQIQSNQ